MLEMAYPPPRHVVMSRHAWEAIKDQIANRHQNDPLMDYVDPRQLRQQWTGEQGDVDDKQP